MTSDLAADLTALGWDDRLRRAYARYDHAGQRPGRALRVDRGVCTVATRDGLVRASLSGSVLAEMAADPTAQPCAGDWLVIRTWPDARITVEAVLPRAPYGLVTSRRARLASVGEGAARRTVGPRG